MAGSKKRSDVDKSVPPYGIHWPVVLDRVIDGDTISVLLPGREGAPIHVRLVDCWCPEVRTAAGKIAKKTAEELLAGQSISVLFHIVPVVGTSLISQLNLKRVMGTVYIHGLGTLNSLLVQAGVAEARPGRSRKKEDTDGET